MVVVIVICMIVAACVFACCKVSGDCSREEEKEGWESYSS